MCTLYILVISSWLPSEHSAIFFFFKLCSATVFFPFCFTISLAGIIPSLNFLPEGLYYLYKVGVIFSSANFCMKITLLAYTSFNIFQSFPLKA